MKTNITVNANAFRTMMDLVAEDMRQDNPGFAAGIEINRHSSGKGVTLTYVGEYETVVYHDRSGRFGTRPASAPVFVLKGDKKKGSALETFFAQAHAQHGTKVSINPKSGMMKMLRSDSHPVHLKHAHGTSVTRHKAYPTVSNAFIDLAALQVPEGKTINATSAHVFKSMVSNRPVTTTLARSAQGTANVVVACDSKPVLLIAGVYDEAIMQKAHGTTWSGMQVGKLDGAASTTRVTNLITTITGNAVATRHPHVTLVQAPVRPADTKRATTQSTNLKLA